MVFNDGQLKTCCTRRRSVLWDLSGFCITAVRRWRALKRKTLCETAITYFKGGKTREKAARLEFQQDFRTHQMRVGKERDAVVGCALTSAGLYPQSPFGHTAPSTERRDFFSMSYVRQFLADIFSPFFCRCGCFSGSKKFSK